MSSLAPALSASDVWCQILAPKFIRFREVLMTGARPHGQRAMKLHAPTTGAAVVDLGCGFGDTTLELAERVGPTGHVVGVDLVPAFLDFAQTSAAAWRSTNVRFEVGDVETFRVEMPVDYLFARFGTMFFERPLAAFRRMRAMLRADGRLVMTTWRPIAQNPWLGVAKEVARRHLPALREDAVSCGPGPFSLADPELVRALVLSAGFREVSCTASDAATCVGRDLEEAVDFQLALGPAGELVREAGPLHERTLAALRDALREALEPYLCEEGVLMPSGAWIVEAR